MASIDRWYCPLSTMGILLPTLSHQPVLRAWLRSDRRGAHWSPLSIILAAFSFLWFPWDRCLVNLQLVTDPKDALRSLGPNQSLTPFSLRFWQKLNFPRFQSDFGTFSIWGKDMHMSKTSTKIGGTCANFYTACRIAFLMISFRNLLNRAKNLNDAFSSLQDSLHSLRDSPGESLKTEKYLWSVYLWCIWSPSKSAGNLQSFAIISN